jgi:hypothetical protein
MKYEILISDIFQQLQIVWVQGVGGFLFIWYGLSIRLKG